MPQLVRSDLRFNRWLETEGLQPQDFPADAITDLRTRGNQLSVYEVADSIAPDRIAVAIFAGKSQLDDIGYAVFDRVAVENLGIQINPSDGGTCDAAVNALHYDLTVGTAGKLLELAGVIAGGQVVSILKKRVAVLLRDGFESGQLDHTKGKSLFGKVKAVIPTRLDWDSAGADDSTST